MHVLVHLIYLYPNYSIHESLHINKKKKEKKKERKKQQFLRTKKKRKENVFLPHSMQSKLLTEDQTASRDKLLSCKPVNTGLVDDTNVINVTEVVVVIQTIANNKMIWDAKSNIVCFKSYACWNPFL